jgi:hypothetical protein
MGRNFLDLFSLDITDHQARLLGLEARDDGLAYALGGTGDDHDFVLQSLAVSRLGHRR